MTTYEEIKAAFRALPKEQQINFLEEADEELCPEIDDAELARRIEEVRSGTAELLTMEQSRAELRKIVDELAR